MERKVEKCQRRRELSIAFPKEQHCAMRTNVLSEIGLSTIQPPPSKVHSEGHEDRMEETKDETKKTQTAAKT